MSLCKLRTPSCSHYEHFHVYLAYRRQTGNVVTRQTFDGSPRLTRPPTAHISRGENFRFLSHYVYGICDVGGTPPPPPHRVVGVTLPPPPPRMYLSRTVFSANWRLHVLWDKSVEENS